MQAKLVAVAPRFLPNDRFIYTQNQKAVAEFCNRFLILRVLFPIFALAFEKQLHFFYQKLEFVVMPKMKTHSSAKKRFKLTGTGKLKRRRAGLRHILTKKSKKRKNVLGQAAIVHPADEKRMKNLLCK